MYPRFIVALMLLALTIGVQADPMAPGAPASANQKFATPKPKMGIAPKAQKKTAPQQKLKPQVMDSETAKVDALLKGAAETMSQEQMTDKEKKTEKASPKPVERKQVKAPGNLPKRGFSKEVVKTKFGDPQQVKEATGVPPIERWVYDAFTVYFEREHVIHTVAHNRDSQ